MSERFEMRVSDEWLRGLDEERGDVPRATFLKRVFAMGMDERTKFGPREVRWWDAPWPSTSSPASEPASGSPVSPEMRGLANVAESTRRASAAVAGVCPDCGKAQGVHKGSCPQHPRNR